MEIKINREIRGYQESVLFGLSLRQMICSVMAIGAAVGIYYGLRPLLGEETVSWLCIVGAAPVAAMGFFKYNNMTLEQFAVAWLRSEFLCAGVRKYQPENLFWLAIHAKRKGADLPD